MKRADAYIVPALVLGLTLFIGCGKEEEKKEGPQSFEEFAAEIEVKPEEVAPRVEEEAVEDERLLIVGAIGPRTGEQAEYGLMTLEGASMALDSLNASGGIGGRRVELRTVDNRGSDGGTQEAMAGLIDEGVMAIIGAPTGWSTFTPVYTANDRRTVFISAGTRRHIGRSGPFVFRYSLPGERAAEGLIEYCVKEEGYKEFALVTVMEDEALNVSSFFRIAIQNAGAAIKTEGHIFADPDIPAAVKELKGKLPLDAVVFVGSSRSAGLFLSEARKQGVKLPLIGGEELHTEEFLRAGNGVEGSLVYAGFSPLDETPAVKSFIDSYKRKKKGLPPATFVAEAYDSFMLVADAVKRAGSTRPGEVMAAMMDTKGFEGITGIADMDDKGEITRDPYILKVVMKKNGPAFSLVSAPHHRSVPGAE
ncbi:MAG: ABC transporter substrate-binding protein [Thermodesulfobacteriota bacterium]